MAERFTAWKHLANAGLIEGNYSGISSGGVGTYSTSPGTNVPAAKTANAFFDLHYTTANVYWYSASNVNNTTLILYGIASNNYGALKPEEAWNIDTKMDDGSPVYGKFFTTIKSSVVAPNCTTSDASSATYDLAVTAKNCMSVSIL